MSIGKVKKFESIGSKAQINKDITEETKTFNKDSSIKSDADIDIEMLKKQLGSIGKPVVTIDSTTQMFNLIANRKKLYSRNLPALPEELPEQEVNVTKVDNSATKYFPKIEDQGELNSCTAWASVYYQMSYMVNKELDRDGKLEVNTFSPIWVYNMINDGSNNGTFYSDVLAVLAEVGAVPTPCVPLEYRDRGENIRNLHAKKANFMLASKYKVSQFYAIDLKNRDNDTVVTNNDDRDLETIKQALLMGEILSATTYSDNWNRDIIKSSDFNKENNDYVGETIVTRCDGYYAGAHRITIVGFDDNIWVDINQNGIVENGEKGAFKIANSWGPESDNNGFIWISYDALNKVSSVPDSDNVILTSLAREAALFDVVGFKVDVNGQDNDVFLNINMATDNAGEVAVNIVAKDKTTGVIVGDYNPIPFAYSTTIQNIGVNAFDGTYNEYAEGNFYIDLSNAVKGLSKDNFNNYDWEITIVDLYEDASRLKVNNVDFYIKSTDNYIDTAVNETVELNWNALNINFGSINNMSLSEIKYPEAVG